MKNKKTAGRKQAVKADKAKAPGFTPERIQEMLGRLHFVRMPLPSQDPRVIAAAHHTDFLGSAFPTPAGKDYLVVLIPVCGAFLQVAVHMPTGRVLYHSDGTGAWETAEVQGRVRELPT